jgi:hypothetical protein
MVLFGIPLDSCRMGWIRADAVELQGFCVTSDEHTRLQDTFFNTLDDGIVLRIFNNLGDTICLGAPPPPRAALLPLQTNKLGVELGAPVSEASTPVPLRTPQLKPPTSARITLVYDEPTPKPVTRSAEDARVSDQLAPGNTVDAANATALQALACVSRRFRRLVFQHICNSCICTVPTLVSHAVRNMSKGLTSLDLHRGGAFLQDHHIHCLPVAGGLRSLNLSECSSLTANSLASLRHHSNLTSLDLSHCRCAASAPLTA